jgi:hypothetical protein
MVHRAHLPTGPADRGELQGAGAQMLGAIGGRDRRLIGVPSVGMSTSIETEFPVTPLARRRGSDCGNRKGERSDPGASEAAAGEGSIVRTRWL